MILHSLQAENDRTMRKNEFFLMLAEGESLLEEKKVRIFQFFSHQILILTE